MAPRFKQCRRLGVNVCGHPKAMKRAGSPAFAKRKKPTEYSKQLTEKQKLKAYYGVLERQLHHYYEKALKSDMMTGDALVIQLERRLDNAVYRIGFGNSIRLARQLVSHGHILVNGKKVDIPSVQVKPGSTIEVKEKSRNMACITASLESTLSFKDFVEVDKDNKKGKYVRLPERKELNNEVNELLIIEYYNR